MTPSIRSYILAGNFGLLDSYVLQHRQALQALQLLLAMPEYDGTPETSRQRLKAKNAAKAVLRAAASMGAQA
jgi:hypothetical protein